MDLWSAGSKSCHGDGWVMAEGGSGSAKTETNVIACFGGKFKMNYALKAQC